MATGIGIGAAFYLTNRESRSDADFASFLRRHEAVGGVLTDVEKNRVLMLIRGLKQSGLWEKAYAIPLFIGATTAADSRAAAYGVLLKRETNFTPINVGADMCSALGYQGNESTSYYDTNISPLAEGYSATDFSLGVYSRTNNISSVGQADMALLNIAPTLYVQLYSRFRSDISNAYFDCVGSLTIFTAPNTDATGFWLGTRTSLTNQAIYKNGAVLFNTGASDSVTMPIGNLFFGAVNVDGVPFDFSGRQYAFGWIGAGLSAADVAALNGIVQTYVS